MPDDDRALKRYQRINRTLKPFHDLILWPSRLPGLRQLRAATARLAFRCTGYASPMLLIAAALGGIIAANQLIEWLAPGGGAAPARIVGTVAAAWTIAAVMLGAADDNIDALVERALQKRAAADAD